ETVVFGIRAQHTRLRLVRRPPEPMVQLVIHTAMHPPTVWFKTHVICAFGSVDFLGVCCRWRYSAVRCRCQASKISRLNWIPEKVGGFPRNPFLKHKADLLPRTKGRQAHAYGDQVKG